MNTLKNVALPFMQNLLVVVLSADAYHMTAPHPEGLGAYLVMKNCLEDAG
jgi:3-oxoacyl-(acyl-carrier-protein) synthase